MKALILITFFLLTTSHAYADLKWTAREGTWDNQEAIFKTPPEQISEEQFYVWEENLIAFASGSGGHFLSQDLIDWILKMEKFYLDKKTELKDPNGRHGVIANSYFNNGLFEKAMEECKKIGYQAGFEEAEWHLKNKGLVGGSVVITEHDGPIKDESQEGARTEDANYLFISVFKGPIYRYNKAKNTHAVIYGPEQYSWSDKLEIDGDKLKIQLRLDSGNYVFDNVASTIHRIDTQSLVADVASLEMNDMQSGILNL